MMGPELFKRWMDMFFWWLPRESSERKGGRTGPQQAEAATARTTPRPGEGAAGGASAGAPQQPATAPDETPTTDRAAARDDARPADDLTAIKGVGPAMAGRLQDMGIRTFEDLAAANAKRVTKALRDHSVVISEKKVEEWVRAAGNQR